MTCVYSISNICDHLHVSNGWNKGAHAMGLFWSIAPMYSSDDDNVISLWYMLALIVVHHDT